jgi:hypothetical protein
MTWNLISPWWLGLVIFGVLGAAAGLVVYRREQAFPRATLFLLLGSLVAGCGPAFRLDWAQRTASRMRDPERQLTHLDANEYFRQREKWNQLTPVERWRWRGAWFAGTGGVTFFAGSLTAAVAHRIARRQRDQSRESSSA